MSDFLDDLGMVKNLPAPRRLLTQNSWLVHSSSENFENVIFENDGRLLLSVNGHVEEGKWSYLKKADALLIEYNGRKSIYNIEYHDKRVFVFNIDGSKNSRFYLTNRKEFITENFSDYISRLNSVLEYGSNIKSFKILSEEFSLAKKLDNTICLYKNGEHVTSGEYDTDDERFYVREGNVVFRKKKYIYNNDITVWQSKEYLTEGDIVENISGTDLTISSKFGYEYVVNTDENGMILNKYSPRARKQIKIIMVILLFALFLITVANIFI